MSTQISWTDETWNPTTGCSKVSEGCSNCYAAQMAPRLAAMGQKGYTDLPWTAPNAPENVFTHEDRLEKPLHWRKPRRVFVDSMSDLFHEHVSDEFILRVWQIMRRTPQHTYQILTKRPERMARVVRRIAWAAPTGEERKSGNYGWQAYLYDDGAEPLPNVWLGTSVEDQRAADERIPHLLATPSAVRFLSCEPLLGPVEFSDVTKRSDAVSQLGKKSLDGIHWVIAGGESGPGYREMDHEWARGLRDQCVAAGVPYFFKQSSGRHNEMEPFLDGESWHQFPRTDTRTEVNA